MHPKGVLDTNEVKLKSRLIYGSKLIDSNHNRLEIDVESAKLVRMIFDMFLHQDMI